MGTDLIELVYTRHEMRLNSKHRKQSSDRIHLPEGTDNEKNSPDNQFGKTSPNGTNAHLANKQAELCTSKYGQTQ